LSLHDTIMLIMMSFSFADSLPYYAIVNVTIWRSLAVSQSVWFVLVTSFKQSVMDECFTAVMILSQFTYGNHYSYIQDTLQDICCCCCCLLQTTLSCQVTNTSIDFRSKYTNSVVSVVASGAQILSKNCKHLCDCR